MEKTVFYWRGSAEVRHDLLTALSRAGCRVIQHRTLENILDSLDRDRPSLLIADASASTRDASQRILELSNTSKLYSIPLVLLSVHAEKRAAALIGSYAAVIAVDVPFRLEAVVRKLTEVLYAASGTLPQVSFPVEGAAEEHPSAVSEHAAPSDEDAPAAKADEVEEPSPEPAVSAAEAVPSNEPSPEPAAQPAAAATADEEAHADASSEHTRVTSVNFEEIEKTPVEMPLEPGSPVTNGTSFVEQAPEPSKYPQRGKVEDQSEKLRERLRKCANPANLPAGYGGETFAIARRPDDFDDAALLPAVADAERLKAELAELARVDQWLATHSKRVTFVAAALAKAFSLGAERDRSIRLAGLCLGTALKNAPLELRHCDIIHEGIGEHSSAIGKLYVRGAQLAVEAFQDQRAAGLMQIVGELLSGSSNATGEMRQDAELALAVDLSARSCWAYGFWNPVGAYRAIKYFRGGKSPLRDRAIGRGVSKVLGEAVTSHVTVGNCFARPFERSDMDDMPLMRAQTPSKSAADAIAATLSSLGIKPRKVQLFDLTEGMVLTEPLLALDGKMILDANVVLDEEIVLDLWQLAAVRALKAHVGVAVVPAECRSLSYQAQ